MLMSEGAALHPAGEFTGLPEIECGPIHKHGDVGFRLSLDPGARAVGFTDGPRGDGQYPAWVAAQRAGIFGVRNKNITIRGEPEPPATLLPYAKYGHFRRCWIHAVKAAVIKKLYYRVAPEFLR